MKCVFGPVPSRRLGQSLGIDPIPLKTCNWNCVYCQLGRSKPIINQRSDYIPAREIIAQVEEALHVHKPGEIDWVTFVGSGETTLHAGLGHMIQQVKSMTTIPVAVITNGSLFYLPEMRQELMLADAVMPSLDAGTAHLYQKINRPHPHLDYDAYIAGLAQFRQQYKGKFWLEVMLIKGLNDTPGALQEIAGKINLIHPDEIHLLLPTRPPAESWVKPADEEGVHLAQMILGSTSKIFHPIKGSFDLSGADSLFHAVISIITRHPMKESELLDALKRFSQKEMDELMTALKDSGEAQVVERYGERYWSAFPAQYSSKPTDDQMDKIQK